MEITNYSNLRKNLKEYMDKASKEHQEIFITRSGSDTVVMLSIEKFKQLTTKQKKKK